MSDTTLFLLTSIFGILSLVLSIMYGEVMGDEEYSPYFKHILAMSWFLFFCGAGWLVMYNNQDWQYTEGEVVVKTISDEKGNWYDAAVVNGNVINLNEKYGQDFEDGQKLKTIQEDTSVKYLGLSPGRVGGVRLK